MTSIEIIPTMGLGLALSMDAFAVSIGMGMCSLKKTKIVHTGLIIGLFHFFFPLIGASLGNIFSERFNLIASIISSVLLTLIGIEMMWQSFFFRQKKITRSKRIRRFFICFFSKY